jgi:LytS/YehU family sensor histidine kinase
LVTKNVWPENSGFNAFTFDHIVEVTIGVLYVTAIGATIKLTYEWINEKRKNEELQKTQLRTELNFLKSQIQPHFFFNTLNNLYALIIKKSPNAPDVVLKLSEIMQYVLYDSKEQNISLLKEINYIYSYLDLEKLRYGDRVKSKIEIIGNMDEIEIPPLLFLPFIENCFKHGTANNNNIKVDIRFELTDNFLFFTVANTFYQTNKINQKHGIGIENVKRRLQLLYGENFTLETEIKKTKFKVLLKFPIK